MKCVLGCACKRHAILTLEERFWAKVNKDGPIHPILKTQCWIWTSSKAQGYGKIGLSSSRKTEYTHRVAWFLETGAWPNLQVLHHCDVRACVRFSHLFEGTQKDNIEDAAKKGKMARLGQYQPKGEDSINAAITQETADAVRALYQWHKRGNITKIMEQFQISRSLFYRIITNKKYTK